MAAKAPQDGRNGFLLQPGYNTKDPEDGVGHVYKQQSASFGVRSECEVGGVVSRFVDAQGRINRLFLTRTHQDPS